MLSQVKKISISFITSIAAIALLLPVASSAWSLSNAYKAVYCYPTGSYWVAQINAYPDYYAASDAYYRSLYGPGTIYC